MTAKIEYSVLISEFFRFNKENGRYPFAKEMSEKNGYPSSSAYIRRWGSWVKFLESVDIIGDDDWYKCDERVIRDNYENGSQEDIIDKLMVKRKWSSIKQKASKLGVRRSKEIRRVFSDEYLIGELQRFHVENGRTPRNEDFTNNKPYPSPKCYWKRFGSWNNALKKAGLTLNNIMTHSKELIIEDIKSFYLENGRSPFYNELKFSRTLTNHYWGSWNEMLIECDIPVNKDYHGLKTKEDGIKFLNDVYNEIGRIPSGGDIDKKTNVNRDWFRNTFGSWNNALIESGLIKEGTKLYKGLTKSQYVINNNLELCRSVPEAEISNLFIANNLKYDYGTYYSEVIPNFSSYSKFDWKILNVDPIIYVEYFGLYYGGKDKIRQEYREKADRKIAALKENKINNFIALYRDDLKNNFSGLIEKFKAFGVHIESVEKERIIV